MIAVGRYSILGGSISEEYEAMLDFYISVYGNGGAVTREPVHIRREATMKAMVDRGPSRDKGSPLGGLPAYTPIFVAIWDQIGRPLHSKIVPKKVVPHSSRTTYNTLGSHDPRFGDTIDFSPMDDNNSFG